MNKNIKVKVDFFDGKRVLVKWNDEGINKYLVLENQSSSANNVVLSEVRRFIPPETESEFYIPVKVFKKMWSKAAHKFWGKIKGDTRGAINLAIDMVADDFSKSGGILHKMSEYERMKIEKRKKKEKKWKLEKRQTGFNFDN